ncbi:MAG: DUF354 domain-containing protein, partial [Methanococcaceae archaeon]
MNILIDINHPAHVHVFKNFSYLRQEAGDNVLFTTREKECTVPLLVEYKMDYRVLGFHEKGILNKLKGLAIFDYKLFRIASHFKPDLFLSLGSVYASQIAFLMRKVSIVLDDTEHSGREHLLYRPFASAILNPSCFLKNLGRKQILYRSYHELAYLHPKYYKFNNDIFKILGLENNERFVILRFVSWEASHDRGQKGLTTQIKIKLARELSRFLKVFITSESNLPGELEQYRLRARPGLIHDVLAAATLFIGEGATMASECAMLGTPAIYVNTLDSGVLEEQEKYGLIISFRKPEGVLEKSLE